MGKMIITQRYIGWVMEKHLELTAADYALREKRQAERYDAGFTPRILGWQKRVMQHLEPCPDCGKQPYCNCTWREKDGYNYKLMCDCYPQGMLECGDWYRQLSRAGLDWNFRVRHEKGEPHKFCPHW